MPCPPLPDDANESELSTSSTRKIQMRWRRDDHDEPVLVEVSVGAPWAFSDIGRHVLAGIVDVELPTHNDICEDVAPAPDGTPIPLGAGQQMLVTCQLLGALFDVQ